MATSKEAKEKNPLNIILVICGIIFVVVFIQFGIQSTEARWSELDQVGHDLGLEVVAEARDVKDVFPELESTSIFYARQHQKNVIVHALEGVTSGADVSLFDFGFRGRTDHEPSHNSAVTMVVARQKASDCPDLEIHPPAVQDNLPTGLPPAVETPDDTVLSDHEVHGDDAAAVNEALQGSLGDYLAAHLDLSVMSHDGRLAAFAGWGTKPAADLPKLLEDAAGVFAVCGAGR